MAPKVPSKLRNRKKHFKAVSQKKKLFRSNDPLLSVLMYGINHTIIGLNHVSIPVMLMQDDFKSHHKVRIDNHCFNKDNMPSKFKFKEYCPLVFRNLRSQFGVADTDYLNSLTRSPPKKMAITPGRSGACVMVSYNKKYIIKIISSEDVAEMHILLTKYHGYVVGCHGKTLLPQYLGMYRTTVDYTETYLLVMRNVFGPELCIHKKYDLKGSTVDRQASEKEKAIHQEKELPMFKDNDFVHDKVNINIGEIARLEWMQQLENDVMFLAENKLLGYSLCVGIHDIQKAEENIGFDEDDGDDEDDQEALGQDPADPESAPYIFYPDFEQSGPDTGPDTEGEDNDFNGTPPDSPNDVVDYEAKIRDNPYAIRSAPGAPRKEIYCMSLIDILTHWNTRKKAAHSAKTVKHGSGAEISTVRPEQYAKRFLDFIAKHVV